eukprot:5018291-Prymnesium_polylepis.1
MEPLSWVCASRQRALIAGGNMDTKQEILRDRVSASSNDGHAYLSITPPHTRHALHAAQYGPWSSHPHFTVTQIGLRVKPHSCLKHESHPKPLPA